MVFQFEYWSGQPNERVVLERAEDEMMMRALIEARLPVHRVSRHAHASKFSQTTGAGRAAHQAVTS